MTSACKKHKGCKIGVSGGSILGDIKKTANKVGSTITGGIKVGGQQLSSQLKSLNKTALKNDWGGKFEAIKSAVPKDVTEAVVSAALQSTGMDESSANIAAGTSVGALYEVDFSESLENQGDEALIGGVKGGVKAGIKSGIGKSGTSSAGSGFHGRKGRVSQHPKGLHQNARDDVKEPVSGRGLVKKNISHGYLQPHADPNIQFGGKGLYSGGSMIANGEGLYGGSMIANGKGLYSGSGAKRPKLVKGSLEAKQYMESIRRKRK